MTDAIDSTTPQTPLAVRHANGTDTPRMIETLALAFADDPVVSWVVRDDDRRAEAIRRVFALELAAALPHGEVHLTADVEGVAVWFPPDTWQTDPADAEHLAAQMTEICGEQRSERAFALFEAMERTHPRQLHRYLHWLGVTPTQQNRGVGGALLRSMVGRCDADGLPAYLEATSPRNVPLYERHGFVVTDELRVPGGCPPLWLMWREPR